MRTAKPYVLLAEDDEDDVIIFKSVFSRHFPDVQVIHFPDGNDLLDFLTICKPGSQPSVLLLDYQMPFLYASGILEFLRSRADLEPMVKIVWSVSRRQEEESACLEAGAHQFLEKPVTEEEWNKLVSHVGSHFAEPSAS